MVKPRIFLGHNNNNFLNILKGEIPFKMHRIIYIFPEKEICVPTLPKISDPNT